MPVYIYVIYVYTQRIYTYTHNMTFQRRKIDQPLFCNQNQKPKTSKFQNSNKYQKKNEQK